MRKLNICRLLFLLSHSVLCLYLFAVRKCPYAKPSTNTALYLYASVWGSVNYAHIVCFVVVVVGFVTAAAAAVVLVKYQKAVGGATRRLTAALSSIYAPRLRAGALSAQPLKRTSTMLQTKFNILSKICQPKKC